VEVNASTLSRALELIAPIEAQIDLCTTSEDRLLLATAMLDRAKEIFDEHLTIEGRKILFKEFQ